MSKTLNATRFGTEAHWNSLIKDLADYKVGLTNSELTTSDLDLLSPASEDILSRVYEKYGHFDVWDLRDLTHSDACPEWQDPHGSSIPIKIADVLRLHGKSEEEADEIIRFIKEQDAYQQLIADLV